MYLNCLVNISICVAEGLRQGMDIERSKVQILWEFYCLFFFFFFSFFFHLLFLVWKFDVLFVGLLFFLMVTVNRRGRYYY